MKLLHLILFLSVTICNEIVVEMIISDDHKVSLIDGSAEEKAESETHELEGETKVNCTNEFHFRNFSDDSLTGLSIGCSISNVMNPYIEIHSPPPDLVKFCSIH